jgi:DME family drug/metabolite transporter
LGSTSRASISSSPSDRHAVRGYLFIAAAALCWGVSATLGRAVFTGRLIPGAVHPIEPLILAQSRTTLSFLTLFPVLVLVRGTGGLALDAAAGDGQRQTGNGKRDFIRCLVLGVLGMAASNYFYYLAIQKTNVATAIILQYTAPIWVLLYMVMRGLQRPTLRRMGSIALALVGIALVIGLLGPGHFTVNTIGLVAAELAAFSFAYYNVAGSRLLARYDRWRVLVWSLLGAALFWMVVNPPWVIVQAHYSAAQWLFLFVFAMTSVLAPFSLYFGGLQFLDATRAIVTSCLEPVFAIVIAAVVLGEALGPMQIIGIIVVLAATILVQLPDRQTGAPAVAVEPIE